jgi:hypothetical protein
MLPGIFDVEIAAYGLYQPVQQKYVFSYGVLVQVLEQAYVVVEQFGVQTGPMHQL